jgi:hypothetical protein
MKRFNLERLKFFVLLILVATSIIQVGILWGYQNHGLPIYFLTNLFSKSSAAYSNINIDKENYFFPYKIIVSDGKNKKHWLIGKKNSSYDKLWNEAREYIKCIFDRNLKPESVSKFDVINWGRLVSNKPVTLEFKSNINLDIIKWFMDIQNLNSSEQQVRPTGIFKMVISPADDEENWKDTVYICDDEKIYKYYVPAINNLQLINSQGFNTLVGVFDGNDKLKSFSIMNEYFPRKSSISQDILVVAEDPKYREYYTINCLPLDIGDIKINPKNIATKVLGIEEGSYDQSEDKTGAAIFQKPSNIYSYSRAGLLEYKFLEPQDSIDKLDINSAFEKAMNFIDDKKKRLMPEDKNSFPEVSLYLSGINEQNPNFYTFTFDYSLSFNQNTEDIPVTFADLNGNIDNQTHAIKINANSKRVLSCSWYLKKFDGNRETSYNVDFTNLLDKINNPLFKNKDVTIKDVGVCYKIYEKISNNIEPSWMITYSKNNINEIQDMQMDKK